MIVVRREVSDEELYEAAQRVRRHARRERLAMVAAVAIVLASLTIPLLLSQIFPSLDSRSLGRFFWLGLIIGFLAAAGTYRRLKPRGDPLADQ